MGCVSFVVASETVYLHAFVALIFYTFRAKLVHSNFTTSNKAKRTSFKAILKALL